MVRSPSARTSGLPAVPAPFTRALTLTLVLLALAAAVCLRPLTADAAAGEPPSAPSAPAAVAQSQAAVDQTSADDGDGGRYCSQKPSSTEAHPAPQAVYDAALAPAIRLPGPVHPHAPRDGGRYAGPAPPAPSPVSLSVLRI
ncbi:hypothetical protein [Spirillospora sp. NPDC048819]|uniref:hypothetical protein n=1 Tax=Spirillospora sp. NPDC048819 TaxID=3155268 RepID=UPI0033F58C79